MLNDRFEDRSERGLPTDQRRFAVAPQPGSNEVRIESLKESRAASGLLTNRAVDRSGMHLTAPLRRAAILSDVTCG